MTNKGSRLDRVLGALADSTRRSMLEQLGACPASISELARPAGITLPTTLKHIEVLTGAGLVATTKKGRVRMCSLRPEGLSEAKQWLDDRSQLWTTRLDKLTAALDNPKGEQYDND